MKALISKLQKQFSEIETTDIEAALVDYYIKKKQLNFEKSTIIEKFMQGYQIHNVELEK